MRKRLLLLRAGFAVLLSQRFGAGYAFAVVRVRGEHLLHRRLLGTTGEVGQLLQSVSQTVGVEAKLGAFLDAVLVRGRLLLLRELGAEEGLRELVELRVGEPAGGVADGAGGIDESGRHVGLLHGVLHVGVGYVADLMADDAHQFVVVHDVHQRAEDAHAAVARGEGVDVCHEIDLEVERHAVHLLEALREAGQALGILRVVLGHFVVFVHPLDRLVAEVGDVGIAQCDGLGHFADGLSGFVEVDALSADSDLRLSGGQGHG